MKLVNCIIDKFGSDKVMHFLTGGWITSIFSPFGYGGLLIGIIITISLSIMKEQYLDDEFDENDVYASAFGGFFSVIIYLLFQLFI